MSLMKWLIENVDWIFSGIGILVLSTIGGFIFKKNQSQQKIEAGNNSVNIQGSSNVKVRTGKTDDAK